MKANLRASLSLALAALSVPSFAQDPSAARPPIPERVRERVAARLRTALEDLRSELLALAEEEEKLRLRFEARTRLALERLEEELASFLREEAGSAVEGAGARRGEVVEAAARAPRPYLGVEVEEKEGRLRIVAVLPGTPAESVRLAAGDEVLTVGGEAVASESDLREALGKRRAGEALVLGIRRGGAKMELRATLGTRSTEEGGGPGPTGQETKPESGEPPSGKAGSAAAVDFDESRRGATPSGWSFGGTGPGPPGRWIVVEEASAPTPPHVLKQASDDATESRFPVALFEGGLYEDFFLSVRFKPVSGRVDQAGGLVFRAKDADNYLICRANALEGNFRVYTVIGGERRQIAGRNLPVAANEWHRMRVECRGSRIRCFFDDHEPLEVETDAFRRGKVGLWTKADSVSLFDDFRVEPIR